MSNTPALKNPAVLATVASSKEGQKAIGQTVNAAKIVLLAGGAILVGRYAWSQYKNWRADKYARDNIGNPNVIAASIIYESFTRFGFPEASFLSWIIPEINISTNEAALNEIAYQVSNPKAVSDAYYMLFNRTLSKDLQNGLSTDELQTFWNIINNKQNTETTAYPINTKLYAAMNNIIVNEAEFVNGEWVGTNVLYGQFNINDTVGDVIATGVVDSTMTTDQTLIGQNYYIVQQRRSYGQCLFNCQTGVVVQSQVRNKQL